MIDLIVIYYVGEADAPDTPPEFPAAYKKHTSRGAGAHPCPFVGYSGLKLYIIGCSVQDVNGKYDETGINKENNGLMYKISNNKGFEYYYDETASGSCDELAT